MIDERYSVVFDYLTKGGKPTILQSPPVIITHAPGGAAGGLAQGAAGALLVGVLSAVTGGLLKGFARSQKVTIPKSNTAHTMTRQNNPFATKVETPKITIPVRRSQPAQQQQRIPETARQQADATNDAYNKGQADSVAALLKRNEEARKRLVSERDSIKKLHKDAMRKIISSPQGQRALEQQQAHINQLTMKQVTEASSKIDYKMPDMSPPVIQMPQQVLQAAQAKKYEPIQLAPGVSNDIRPLQKQQGLNEVTP